MPDEAPVTAAEAFPPGKFIREEMEARGWSIDHLAGLLKWSVQSVEYILGGEITITPCIADQLAAVFGTSSEFFCKLQRSYLRWVQSVDWQARALAAEAEVVRLRFCLEGESKARSLLEKGMESQAELMDDLKQKARQAAAQRLVWTRETPTEDGWYWRRRLPNHHPYIVRITEFGGRLMVELMALPKRPLESFIDDNVPGEWAGPITPPE